MAWYSKKKDLEVEDMFSKKRIRTTTTTADRELKSEIENRRAAYQMDRYVQLREVHEIVKSALHELYDKLGTSTKVAKENRAEIGKMNHVVKRCVQSV